MTFSQIKDLEKKIGSFTSRKKRGENEPSFFIDQKREGDPSNGPEQPIFKLSYSPVKSILTVQFSYFYRMV